MYKFARLINTIVCLKWSQIRGRVLQKLQKDAGYSETLTRRINEFHNIEKPYEAISFPDVYKVEGSTFVLLAIEHSFGDAIDWSYKEYGKLWNYHLQYFNYIHVLEVERAFGLISSFIQALESQEVRLEPYPVTIRLWNWIKWYNNHQQEIDPESREFLLDHIYRHYRYLLQNREFHVDGNHLLENYIVLLMCSLHLGETSTFRFLVTPFYKLMEEQILEDGGHYELSPMYHQLVLVRLLDLYHLTRSLQFLQGDLKDLSQLLRDKLTAMFGWLCIMANSSRTLPYFSDSSLSMSPSAEELIAYARWSGFSEVEGIQANEFCYLPDSKYLRYEHCLGSFCADLGGFGASSVPGHAHADALHFVLIQGSRQRICDTGISTYEDSPSRLYEKSTRAHNTVEIDNVSQADLWKSFRVGRRSVAMQATIDTEGSSLLAKGGLCYTTVNRQVKHFRSIYFLDKEIKLVDTVEGGGVSCRANFHVPGEVTHVSSNIIVTSDGLVFEFFGFERIQLEDVHYYEKFLSPLQATRICVDFAGKHLETLLYENN
jgi:hypothetical protein